MVMKHMRIAISAAGRELDADLDPRFGRARYFIIADLASKAFEVVENRQNLDLPQGAGIQAAVTVADQKVDVLITGHCGPKAFKVLQKANIQIMTGASGTVAGVIAQFKGGKLEAATEAE
jgi:predicted Fe-Mo cluster-binding NifX family protein